MAPPLLPPMVAHCLLVERAEGLVLVDTGFGTADIEKPARLGRGFVLVARPALDYAEAAITQIHRLGFTADDVTDIVLTHLDLDHAGGLADFPRARVHVDATELFAAEGQHTLREKRRYAKAQWAHRPQWIRHGTGGDDWFGFTEVNAVHDEVVLVPLRGHTRGHCGVAVRRPGGGWLLHAGDSFFAEGEVADPPSYDARVVRYQRLTGIDDETRRANQDRLRELHARHPEVTMFCSHDTVAFERLSGAAATA